MSHARILLAIDLNSACPLDSQKGFPTSTPSSTFGSR